MTHSSIIPDISIRGRTSPRRRSTDRAPVTSRYDGRGSNTRMPAAGLARPAMPRNRDTVTAAVIDPWGDGKQRTFATVNRRVDLLEDELSHGRISEAAYRAGRTFQVAFEKAGRLGTSANWKASCSDRTTTQQSAVLRVVERAEAVRKLMAHVRSRLGMIDARLLRRIIGDGLSFAECAALQGKTGQRGQSYVARRFRDALEELAEAWSARGKVQSLPSDKHAAAAVDATDRQDDSLIGSATVRRLEGELAELLAGGARQADVDDVRAELAHLRLRQVLAAARMDTRDTSEV